MVKQLSKNTAIVSSKELGTRCWLAGRFIKGGRCYLVMQCNYPEKKTCQAVQAEIEYLLQERERQVRNIGAKLTQLIKEQI